MGIAHEGQPVAARLAALFDDVRGMSHGEIATYIPALAAADPEWFGLCLMTVDGELYELGDSTQPFTIQSVSKPFVFSQALDVLGPDTVAASVGVEPSGDPFNSITLDTATGRPYNPMVNSGAIVTTSLIDGDGVDGRFTRILQGLSTFAGRPLGVDDDVFSSEQSSGDRNRAIAYLMRSAGMLEPDVRQVLDVYFRQCSVLVDCRDLATMAATLANRGVNPVTGQRAAREESVPLVLSVMTSCGMYDFAGEWAYRVGMPAKSGVSGAVVAVLPGQFGVGVFSPRLEATGNSVRGVAVCEALSSQFHLHMLRGRAPISVVRRSYRGDCVQSKRVRTPDQAAILRTDGDRIRVLELHGDLQLAAAEQLGRAVAEQADGALAVVLDLRRIASVEESTTSLVAGLDDLVAGRGAHLVVAGGPDSLTGEQATAFDDVDSALEWCEDRLLEAHDALVDDTRYARLARQQLLAGLDDEQLAAVEGAMERILFAPGAIVFSEGDAADRIYLVARGRVSIRLDVGDRRHRLATVGPGSSFGEMAVLDGSVRSTAVEVDSPTECFVLTVAALDALRMTHPQAITEIYANLGRILVARLRIANDGIRALEG